MKTNVKRKKMLYTKTYREIFIEKFGEIEVSYCLFPKFSIFKVKKGKLVATTNMVEDAFMEKDILLAEDFDSEYLTISQLRKMKKYMNVFVEHLAIFFGL